MASHFDVIHNGIFSEVSSDSEGFPDNLARDSDYSCFDVECYTDQEFSSDDPRYDWYLDNSHSFYESSSDSLDDEEYFQMFDDYLLKFYLDENSYYKYELTLVFDGKFFEKKIYSHKYIYRCEDLVNYLHYEIGIDNFNLIRKCELLTFDNLIRSGDIIHINAGFDKYLSSSWNRIMHALNGNVEDYNKCKNFGKNVYPSDNIERNSERTHLPTLKDKDKKMQEEYYHKLNDHYCSLDSDGLKNEFVPSKNISSKVFLELSERDKHIGNIDVRLDVPAKVESEDKIKVDVKSKEDKVKISNPNFNKNNLLEDKKFEYYYSIPNTTPIIAALKYSTWFGYIPRIIIVPASENSWMKYNCLIIYMILACLSEFHILNFDIRALTNSILYYQYCYYSPLFYWLFLFVNNYFTLSSGWLGFLMIMVIKMLIYYKVHKKLNVMYPLLYYFFTLFVIWSKLEEHWLGYLVCFLCKIFFSYYNHSRLYDRFYSLGSFLNMSFTVQTIGTTYYYRKCTLRKSCNDDLEYTGEDFRRNVDTNFKISQNTCKWFFDEKVVKISEVGYWVLDSDCDFMVEKEFREEKHDGYKVVDLELVSQMSTSKNISLTTAPEVIAERFSNCTNMGPFINYNRGDVFGHDILNNSARLAHCIAMSKRNDNISTDVYNQLFRKGDSTRLIDVADKYSLFY